MSKAKGEAPESELVTRETQATIGLFTGVVFYGAAIGGLFALVFACAYGRVGDVGPRLLSALLALAGFVAIVVIPAIKYPPNPPPIGEAETIAIRTGLYFFMLLLSVVAMLFALVLARKLHIRFGTGNAALIGGAAFIVAIAIFQSGLPTIDEVPDQFPAVPLWHFRLASLGIQAVLWTAIGLMFGYIAERELMPSPRRHINAQSSFES